MNFKETDRIWQAFIEHQPIAPQKAQWLGSYFKQNPAQLEVYVEERSVNALLELAARDSDQESARILSIVDAVKAEQGRIRRREANGTESNRSGVVNIVVHEPKGMPVTAARAHSGRSRETFHAWMASAIALSCLLTGILVWQGIQTKPPVNSSAARIKESEPALEKDWAPLARSNQRNLEESERTEHPEENDRISPGVVENSPPELETASSFPQEPKKADLAERLFEGPSLLTESPTPSESKPAAFGELVQWQDQNSQPVSRQRIGPGSLALESGRAAIEWDGGAKLYFEHPVRVQLLSDNEVKLESGQFAFEIPPGAEPLVIDSPSHRWVVDRRAEFQVILHPSGTEETFVTSGRVIVSRIDAAADPVELYSRGLNQLVANASDSQIPSISVARGRNTFLGQIGIGDHSITTSSPRAFEQLNNGLNNFAPGADEQQRRAWQRFVTGYHQRMRQQGSAEDMMEFIDDFVSRLPSGSFAPNFENFRGAEGNGSSSFQGSININGNQRTFQSREEYERAKQQLLSGHEGVGIEPFQPPGFKGLPGFNSDPNSNSMFDGEININGRSRRFTSPQEFQMFRRRLR